MVYELRMDEHGILRITFHGMLVGDVIDTFVEDFMAYLEQATPERPLRTLTISEVPVRKLSSRVRRVFARLNKDPRLGKSATVGGSRYSRVLIGFVLKATGRDNIRLFGTEEEALAWLLADDEG